jgi:Lon protease-like protein
MSSDGCHEEGEGTGLPAEALAALPIFPLPSTCHYPRELLPLHVFEPRYRDLVEHCLETHRCLGVPLLQPGYEEDYLERPPVHPVMGAGRIVHAERLADGRWNILVEGIARVRMERELPPHQPFRVICASLLADSDSGATAAGTSGSEETLRGLVHRLAAGIPDARAALMELLDRAGSRGHLADILASKLVADADVRQHLLAELDVETRIQDLIAQLAALVLRVPGAEGTLN